METFEEVYDRLYDEIISDENYPEHLVKAAEYAKDYFGKDNVQLLRGYRWAFPVSYKIDGYIEDYMKDYVDRCTVLPFLNEMYLPEEFDQLYRTFTSGEGHHVLMEYLDNCAFGRYSIVIRIPEAMVKNEKSESEKIYDVFLILKFIGSSCDISGSIYMMRSTFTDRQYISGYVHSHINTDRKNICSPERICLGAGPIVTTLDRLAVNNHSEDLWRIFFWELDKVVHTESLQGIPYKHLASIGTRNEADVIGDTRCCPASTILESQTEFREFARKFVQEENIRTGYHYGKYTVDEQPMKWWIKVSNAFIRYVNTSWTEGRRYLHPAKVADGRICSYSSVVLPDTVHDKIDVINFNGKVYNLKILKDPKMEKNYYVIDHGLSNRLKDVIEGCMNIHEGRPELYNEIKKDYYELNGNDRRHGGAAVSAR